MATRPLSRETLVAHVDRMAAESRTVPTARGRLHVLDYPGSEPAVLILPGITSPAITWDFVVRGLQLPRRVIVLDQRGRGLSDPASDGDYGLEAYARDVADVVEHLGLLSPTLLGHSMGARVAAVVAQRFRRIPGQVIAIDPPLSGPGRRRYPVARDDIVGQVREARAGVTVEQVQARFPTWPVAELERRVDWLSSCDEEAVARSHDGFHSEDFFDAWPSVPPPVAFVYGRESPMVDADGAAEAARRNPRAEIIGIPGAGHMIPWDNLPNFVNAIRPLLQSG